MDRNMPIGSAMNLIFTKTNLICAKTKYHKSTATLRMPEKYGGKIFTVALN
jgi:hypothetical protein